MTERDLLELREVLENLKIKKYKTSFLDVINKIDDENIVSNWLSFILDPQNNGIGNKPVDFLLSAVNYDSKIELGDFKEIRREESTNDKKRMDLVIKYTNVWIVIENKIRSSEHGMQTEHYFNYIEKEKSEDKIVKDVVYIYLRPDWNNPDNPNIPQKKYNEEENGFRNLFYSELIKWLKKIEEDEYIEKDKFIYLKKFIENGEKYYMGQELNITNEIQTYIDYMDKITDIKSKYEDLMKIVFSKLINGLKEEFEEEYYINESNTGYIQIAGKNWNDGKNTRKGIHYEIYIREYSKFLGQKEVKVYFDIHMESEVNIEKKKELRNRYKQEDDIKIVKDTNADLWFRLNTKKLDFSTEEAIYNSIKSIIEDMKEIDSKWTAQINKW